MHEASYQTKPIFEMHEIPDFLASRGHEVHFLQFQNDLRFWKSRRAKASQEIAGRVRTSENITLHSPFQIGVPALDRPLVWFSSIFTLRRLFKRYRYDAVFLYSIATTGIQALHFANKNNVPMMFRALDPSYYLRKGPIRFLIRLAEKNVLSKVNLISAHNEALLQYCLDLAGDSKPKGIIQLPPVDIEHFSLGKHPKTSIGKATKMVFLGTVYEFAGLESVIRGLSKPEASELSLDIIGDGPDRKRLEGLSSELGLRDRVIFHGMQPYQKLPELLQGFDVAINPFEPSPLTDMALPQKLIQYLAAGLPVITTKLQGSFATLHEFASIRWLISAEEIIDSLLADPEISFDALDGQRLEDLFGNDKNLMAFETSLKALIQEAK